MNADQRLHRAAHDLRELDVPVPPFEATSARPSSVMMRRVGAPVAAVLLLAFGAIAAVVQETPDDTAIEVSADAPVAVDLETRQPLSAPSGVVRAMSAREEVALISSLAEQPVSPMTLGASAQSESMVPPGAS